MKKLLLAAAFSLFAVPAFAVCPNPITVKDAAGTTQNMAAVNDGSGNCQGAIAAESGAVASGAYASGAFAVGSGADGWNVTEGAKADSAWVSGSGSIVAILKNIANSLAGAIPAGSNTIGTVQIVGHAGASLDAATAAAVPGSALMVAGDAQSTEPAKATTGNLTAALFDLAGKAVTSPYSIRELQLRCAVTLTASTAATTCTGMGAQGASIKIYITDLTCTRSDAGTTSATLTLNDSATTIIDMPNNGGGGGFSHTYNTPLVVAANTAFQVTSGTSLTSVHCSAAGFSGY
jgi:hypothetical protein